jgi:DNA repair exonuclease SbcCD nuclease subunit
MSILIIGDPHYKKSNKDETEQMEKGIMKYLETRHSIIQKIVVLGDVLDTHEKINLFAMKRAVDFLIKLSEHATVYVLIGNHDRPSNDIFLTEEHSLYPLKWHDDIVIVDQVLRDGDQIFVPYVEPGRFMEALGTIKIKEEDLKSGDYRYIFAHQEFFGAQMGGFISQMGDKWSEDYPPVISGHIHDYQILNNVVYVGTPYQTGYGDNPNKAIYLLDEDGELEKIELNIIPKIIVHLPIEEVLNYNFPDDKKVKLVIEGDAAEIRKAINTTEYRRKLVGVKHTIKDIPKHTLPDISQVEGQKRIFSIPNLIKIVKKDCDDLEEEILEQLFPTDS